MKKTFVLLGVVACLAACESINYVPPATPQIAGATKGRPVDVALLQKGRTLLAHRCIECHTLPPLWHYKTEDWPEIVNSMSHRSGFRLARCDMLFTISGQSSIL